MNVAKKFKIVKDGVESSYGFTLPYGTTNTAAGTADKVVTCAGFELATGSILALKFITASTATNITLNINGTGAKPLYYRGAAITDTGLISAGDVYFIRYNGTQYDIFASHQDVTDKLSSSLKGAANGLAELDANGKVPSAQLPSYVDDVLEYSAASQFPETGESGKIYVDTSDNKSYRWSGSSYVVIASDLALGETSSTAYRGDRGKAAYDHATAKGSAYPSDIYKITTNAEGHVTAATAVVKSDLDTLLGSDIDDKADKADTVLDTTLSRGRRANTTVGTGSFAFGVDVEASGNHSHAEGNYTTASGESSHAEGERTTASRDYAHAEGLGTIASQDFSHAEGMTTVAKGPGSHAEGWSTTTDGSAAHAEGSGTKAIGTASHAEGQRTAAFGKSSHAEGEETISNRAYMHACGTYNFPSFPNETINAWAESTHYSIGDFVHDDYTGEDTYFMALEGHLSSSSNRPPHEYWLDVGESQGLSDVVEVVGGGDIYNSSRKNIRALTVGGDEHLKGTLYVNCNDNSTGGAEVATKSDISGKLNKSGGTMSGNLTMGDATNIAYAGTSGTINMIKFMNGDANGHGIVIGGGGLTIIGGGEAASAIASGKAGNTEAMYIGNDSAVYIMSNCQSGVSSAKTFTFDASGNLTVPGTIYRGTQDMGKAVKSISRSGTTFTATCCDGTTFTFTQQDNNTWRGYQIKQYSYKYTVAANDDVSITATNFQASTPSGYTPVAVARYASGAGSGSVIPYRINVRAAGSESMMGLRNITSSSQTYTAAIDILYIQS